MKQPFYFHLRFWKWDITIEDKKWKDHYCLNQVMEGDYECEVCNP